MLLCGIVIWLLPVACDLWRGYGQRLGPSVLCLLAGVLAWLYLPGWLLPPALMWCATTLAMMWLDERDALRRGLCYLVMSALCALLTLTLMHSHYPDGMATGLADMALRLIRSSDDPVGILITCYRYGLAHLPSTSRWLYITLPNGRAVTSAEAVTQLSLSLHLSMERLITASAPALTFYAVTLPPLGAALTGEAARYAHDGMGTRKPFSALRFPAIPVAVTGLLGLMQYMVETGFGTCFTRLCETAFQLATLLQGLAVIRWALRKQQVSKGWSAAAMAVMTLLLPSAARIVGMLDLFMNLRHLEEG